MSRHFNHINILFMHRNYKCQKCSSESIDLHTTVYSTGRGRPIPYLVETPSISVCLAECSDRFLHKKNRSRDLITSERSSPSTSLSPTVRISNQWSATVLDGLFRILNKHDNNYTVDLVTRVDNASINQIKAAQLLMRSGHEEARTLYGQ